MIRTRLLAVLLASLVIPGFCQADYFAVCMLAMMEKASDSTTVGELRAECEKQQNSKAETADDSKVAVIDVRLKPATEIVL